MADKNNANIGFEKEIWDAACVLWGHIPAAEYRKVIIGLIFLRYISAAFDKRYKELVEEGDGFEDDIDAYTMENVFFVPEEARWSTIASAAHTPEIGIVIDNAMKAIEADNKSLKDVLKTMGVNLPFENNADFSKIRTQNDIYINDIIHKTYLKVNEEGTEAAAVTMVEMMFNSAFSEEKAIEMHVNRPFLFILRNSEFPKNYDIIFISKIEEIK